MHLLRGPTAVLVAPVALAFAREGADVAISYLSEEKDARETERLVLEAGRKAILLPGDNWVAIRIEVCDQKAIEEFGYLD